MRRKRRHRSTYTTSSLTEGTKSKNLRHKALTDGLDDNYFFFLIQPRRGGKRELSFRFRFDQQWQRRNSTVAKEDQGRVAEERSLGPDIYPGVFRKQLSEAGEERCVAGSRKSSLSSHLIPNSNVATGTCKREPLPGGGD